MSSNQEPLSQNQSLNQNQNLAAAAQDESTKSSSSSARRIAASRANGAKSQGPTTPEGKAACAATKKNFRHGMLTQTVVLSTEAKDRFEELLADLIDEHRPITRSEREVVEMMAAARWRHLRTCSIQKNDFEIEMSKHSTDAAPPMAAAIAFRSLSDKSNALVNALRYETAYERQFKSALRELKKLKQDRPELSNHSEADRSIPKPSTSSTWDVPDTLNHESENENTIFPFGPSPTNGHSGNV